MDNQRLDILYHIERLGRQEGADTSHAVLDLQREHNDAVQRLYQDTPGELWDIIEVFPPEIWVRIIQDSLPLENYPSALLLFTMVSTKWQNALIATPMLWANIQISGFDEDSLAVLRLFTHLSGDSPLRLTFHVPLSHDSIVLGSILESLRGRLQSIIIRPDKRLLGGYTTSFCDAHIISGIELLLESPQHMSGVIRMAIQSLSFNHIIHGDAAPKTAISFLPPFLRAMHGWCFCALELYASIGTLQHLEEIQTCMPLDDSIPHLARMSQLRTLRMTENQLPFAHSSRDLSNVSASLNLTSVSVEQPDRPDSIKLVISMASNILTLDLRVSYAQHVDLLNVLRSTTRLTRLSVRLSQSDQRPRGSDGKSTSHSNIAPVEGISSLKVLELSAEDVDFTEDEDARSQRSIRRQLLTLITFLYQGVEDATISFNFVEGHTSLVWPYLSHLLRLRRLHLKDFGWVLTSEGDEFMLPELEELDTIASEPLRCLRAPKLLSLALPWDNVCEEAGAFAYPNVRTLCIRYDDQETPRILFPPGNLPSVTSLKIHARSYAAIQPGPLELLTTVSITAESDSTISSGLCISLLYRPEECPTLSNIKLLGFGPEWDILFMMIERRNFLRNSGVSRIRRITLPFVPHELRVPLAGLLRGLLATRPSNEDLSFVATMDAFFDVQIPGCRRCIRNRLYSCNERGYHIGKVKLRRVRNSVYSTAKDPPPPLDTASETLDWIHWREARIREWKAAVSEFGRSSWRMASCIKQVQITPMEITEHDF